MSSGPAFLSERLSYLEENIAAASLPLAEADLADLDAAPPAVGDRY
jgi:aryl-alcohol dehydrogenase-like predicted oxidoreductase